MKISIIHIVVFGFILDYLKKRPGNFDRTFNVSELEREIFRTCFPRVSKMCKRKFFKEMIELELIRRINKQKFEVMSVINNKNVNKRDLDITNSKNEPFPWC